MLFSSLVFMEIRISLSCLAITEEEGRQTTDSDEPWGAIKGKAKVERDSAE